MPNLAVHGIASGILFSGFYWFEHKIFKRSFPFKSAGWQIILANLIDLDHLLANPIYDPLRCSINFHPLHSWYFFPLYFAGLFSQKYKYFFAGIIVHLALDYVDCWF